MEYEWTVLQASFINVKSAGFREFVKALQLAGGQPLK